MYRRNRRSFLLFTVAAVLALGMAGCGGDDDDDEATPPQQTAPTQTQAPQGSDSVTLEMSDHAFRVSGPLTAGGTLRISNVGRELHMMAMGKLKPGKTLADVTAALAEQGEGGGGGGGGGQPTTTASALGAATTTTAGSGTTTTRAGATTTTSAQGQGQGGQEEQDPFAEILDELGLPGGFMSPGQSVEVTVPTLQPGTYALLCFIPTEGEGAPHFAKGMVGQLEVVPGPTPPQPTADVTYRLAPGQPPQGPATLTAGRHTIRFEAGPGSEQLEPGLARLLRGATFSDLDREFTEFFEGEEPPPRGAAANASGQIVFAGFDMLDTPAFYLTANLEPGDYVIVAEDTDPEDRPRPPRELLNVRVS